MIVGKECILLKMIVILLMGFFFHFCLDGNCVIDIILLPLYHVKYLIMQDVVYMQ